MSGYKSEIWERVNVFVICYVKYLLWWKLNLYIVLKTGSKNLSLVVSFTLRLKTFAELLLDFIKSLEIAKSH